MRILHYYDKKDNLVSQHVKMLADNSVMGVENFLASESEQARTLLQGTPFDLLHLHGCWRNSSRSIAHMALRQGTRLVLTPHGQLQSWIQEDRFWQEKLPKRILYQQELVRQAYAVVVQGSMEQECLDRLAWNPRTVVIRNAVLTNSTSPQEMARQTFDVYRKVMDSNPLELMTDDTRSLLKNILIAGITGDQRWIDSDRSAAPADIHIDQRQWRLVFCYAHQEQISDTIRKGIRVMALDTPDIDASQISYFLPDGYQATQSIQQAIGNQFPSENERLLATFRQLSKWVATRQFSIRHLVELNRELRQYPCDEDELADELRERRLWRFASRLMQLASELTGLTEGFMPMQPTSDRTTRKLRKQIDNHLKI